MITPQDCYNKYGEPAPNNKCMILWDVPPDLEIGLIPKRIYCNKDLVEPLSEAFGKLIRTGCVSELKTWDGCFNIRVMRGYENRKDKHRYMSIHSWGCAVDVNAFENQLRTPGKLSKEFVECFTSSGFNWGGNFKRLDPMHFELSSI